MFIIRDRGRSYRPGTCQPIWSLDEGPDWLSVSGPNKEYEFSPMLGDDVAIPRHSRSLPDGTCEAVMTVTVPYAPRYLASIKVLGEGAVDPSRQYPEITKIVTKGDSQRVELINFVE